MISEQQEEYGASGVQKRFEEAIRAAGGEPSSLDKHRDLFVTLFRNDIKVSVEYVGGHADIPGPSYG